MMRLWTAQIEMMLALNDLWSSYLRLFIPSPGRQAITSIETVESAHIGGCRVIRARFG